VDVDVDVNVDVDMDVDVDVDVDVDMDVDVGIILSVDVVLTDTALFSVRPPEALLRSVTLAPPPIPPPVLIDQFCHISFIVIRNSAACSVVSPTCCIIFPDHTHKHQ